MIARCARILFVAFQVLWLNAVVPGHTRGAVPLRGTVTVASVDRAGSCCTPGTSDTHTERRAPLPGDPAKRCAICRFAAHLSTPPVFSLTLTDLGLLDLLPLPPPPDVVSAPRPPAYYPCGPPLA